jgi:putative transposase
MKLLWLALRNAEKKWTYPIKDWPVALHQFAIYFPGQVPLDL